MEQVTVKTKNPNYDGYIRGFKFHEGTAIVPLVDAEAMAEFGVTYEKPKPKKAPAKRKGKAGD